MNEKRNSIVILAKNINMDKEYQNVIDYHEADLVNLLRGEEHLVIEQNNYSFIKVGENRISVQIPYTICLQANYMAIQNPYYNNKWFFAFINNVEYSSDKATIINFTVDEISTWWDYFSKNKKSFVVREHVNDDTVGLHTMPEGLETGEYVTTNVIQDDLGSDLKIIMGSTVEVNDDTNIGGGVYNGIPSGVCYYVYDSAGDYRETDTSKLSGALKMLASHGKSEAVKCVFLAPSWLAPKNAGTVFVANTTQPVTEYMFVPRITALDGYIPKNKKLLCYPYCGIVLSNSSGQATFYNQELWENGDDGMTLVIKGCLTPGCSVRCYPYNYKGIAENYDEGISLGKYPSLNWQTDVYTNWLTQNGISLGAIKLNADQLGQFNGISNIGFGLASLYGGDLSGVAEIKEGINDLWDNMQEKYKHSFMTPTINGSLNCGDVITSSGINKFFAYSMTIKEEFAKSIDDFFTKFGYKVNSLKVPNFTGREYFNYVQIGKSEIIGLSNNIINIPESSMDIINAVFRKGTTIWHNHDNIGNYNLNNTII